MAFLVCRTRFYFEIILKNKCISNATSPSAHSLHQVRNPSYTMWNVFWNGTVAWGLSAFRIFGYAERMEKHAFRKCPSLLFKSWTRLVELLSYIRFGSHIIISERCFGPILLSFALLFLCGRICCHVLLEFHKARDISQFVFFWNASEVAFAFGFLLGLKQV